MTRGRISSIIPTEPNSLTTEGMMLHFSRGNAKLDALEAIIGGPVYTFSILSGWTCPYANDCLSKVHDVNGKRTLKDGPNTKFRCFSATQETIYPAVYNSRRDNFEQLKAAGSSMCLLICQSIPEKAKCIRIHVGGDFYSQEYFDAWVSVAQLFPHIIFYAYTKSLPYWVKSFRRIPDNMVLTASYGGRCDHMIESCNLRHAVVIADEATAQAVIDSGNHNIVPSGTFTGYPIDHNDAFAALPSNRDRSFALLLHGVQPKGSDASRALSKLNGVGSYKRG